MFMAVETMTGSFGSLEEALGFVQPARASAKPSFKHD